MTRLAARLVSRLIGVVREVRQDWRNISLAIDQARGRR